MHMFRPPSPYFVGDCMPFYHEGVFHLYYLLDENHHRGNGGLGGHQWAHASTTDLIHWQHHPLALAIEDPSEASICTGSTFWSDGVYYAFYATRRPDWTQHLCMASSSDGIHFTKDPTNPFLTRPAGYSLVDLRDPFVFEEASPADKPQVEKTFHLLSTSKLEPFPLEERGGCLLHLVSNDLHHWQTVEPFYIPGGRPEYGSVPECPDYFEWNGWYYLIYSQNLRAHYRYSRSPFGPWQRPAVDLLDSSLMWVMKTAPIWENRRIGVAFIGTREGNRDSANVLWAGNAIFRELVQHPDGTLTTRFLQEVQPASIQSIAPSVEFLTPGVLMECGAISIDAAGGEAVAALRGMPTNFSLHCHVQAQGKNLFGLGLRGSGNFGKYYPLLFDPGLRRVSLAEQSIDAVDGLDHPFTLDLNFKDDMVEVCIDRQRCLINRLGELQGDTLFLFGEYNTVTFTDIMINAI